MFNRRKIKKLELEAKILNSRIDGMHKHLDLRINGLQTQIQSSFDRRFSTFKDNYFELREELKQIAKGIPQPKKKLKVESTEGYKKKAEYKDVMEVAPNGSMALKAKKK